MIEPENEMGVIVLFSSVCNKYNLEIVHIGAKFPDAIIRDTNTGKEYRAEFEFASSNFIAHGHDPRQCDMIICWLDDYDNCLLPVMELSMPDKFLLHDATEIEREVMYLRIANARMKRELDKIRQMKLPEVIYAEKEKPVMDKPQKRDGVIEPPPGDGWRIEIAKRIGANYFSWRRGSRENRECVYGGKADLLTPELLAKYRRNKYKE